MTPSKEIQDLGSAKETSSELPRNWMTVEHPEQLSSADRALHNNLEIVARLLMVNNTRQNATPSDQSRPQLTWSPSSDSQPAAVKDKHTSLVPMYEEDPTDEDNVEEGEAKSRGCDNGSQGALREWLDWPPHASARCAICDWVKQSKFIETFHQFWACIRTLRLQAGDEDDLCQEASDFFLAPLEFGPPQGYFKTEWFKMLEVISQMTAECETYLYLYLNRRAVDQALDPSDLT